MKLNKRIFRNIGHNKSFYISSILLTVLAVSFLIASISTGTTVDVTMKDFLDKQQVEEGEFYTITPLEEEDIAEAEEKYDVVIEKQEYVENEKDDKTVRIFRQNEKLNLYTVTEGKDIISKDEILLTQNFAKENGYEIGDSFSLNNQEYTITGYFVRADYAYMLKNTQEIFIDNQTFGLAVLNDEAFETMEDPNVYYSIRYNKDNQKDVRTYLYENFGVVSYLTDYANTRINYTRIQGENYSSMGLLIAPILFLLIMAIIALILGRMVKREQKQIGVLTALGYRKKEIIGHYVRFAAIPGIIGSILGIAFSIPFSNGYTYMAFTDFEAVPYEMHYDVTSIIVSLFIPVILYVLTAVFVVRKILRHSSKELLSGRIGMNMSNTKKVLATSKMKASRKLRIRTLLLNPGRTIVTCMGLIIAGIILVCGFIMKDSCNFIINQGLDNAGSYEYKYYLVTPQNTELSDGEGFLYGSFEVEGKNIMFNLCGIEENSKYIELTTESGNNVNYGDFCMTSAAAAEYGVSVGDDFTFYSPVTMKEHTVHIEEIIDDNTQSVLYTSMANAEELLGYDEGYYNAIMSKEQLDIPDSRVFLENSKQKVKEGMENLLVPVMMIVNILLVLGIVLCFTVVYLTVNMIIEENKYNISMLKVLGFRKGEINKMLINTNHILVPICFVLSIPLGLAICTAAMADTVESYSVYIQSRISIPSIVICLALMLVGYFASLFFLKRKVLKVDMVEGLKETSE